MQQLAFRVSRSVYTVPWRAPEAGYLQGLSPLCTAGTRTTPKGEARGQGHAKRLRWAAGRCSWTSKASGAGRDLALSSSYFFPPSPHTF